MTTPGARSGNLGQAIGLTVGFLAGAWLGFRFGMERWGATGAVVGMMVAGFVGALIGYALPAALGPALPGAILGALFGAAGGRVLAIFWEATDVDTLVISGGVLGAVLGGLGAIPFAARTGAPSEEAPASPYDWSTSTANPESLRDAMGTLRSVGCRGREGSCSTGALSRCSVCHKDYCQAHGDFLPDQTVCAYCRRRIDALP